MQFSSFFLKENQYENRAGINFCNINPNSLTRTFAFLSLFAFFIFIFVLQNICRQCQIPLCIDESIASVDVWF